VCAGEARASIPPNQTCSVGAVRRFIEPQARHYKESGYCLNLRLKNFASLWFTSSGLRFRDHVDLPAPARSARTGLCPWQMELPLLPMVAQVKNCCFATRKPFTASQAAQVSPERRRNCFVGRKPRVAVAFAPLPWANIFRPYRACLITARNLLVAV
jgi:hypothetical protein